MFLPVHGRRDNFAWHTGVLDACKRFRQGDVIEDVGLAFSADGERPITLLAEDAAEGEPGIMGVHVPLHLAMITSQTCDIAGDRSAKYPFVQIAPVYDITGNAPGGLEKTIRKNKVGELIALDGPRFRQENELWVADLRFEAPIEKGLLLNREPILGFADEHGYLRASEKLARVRFRLAVDDAIEKYILKPMRNAFKDGTLDHEPLIDIVLRAQPTSVDASSVRLYAVTTETADVDAIQDSFDRWHVANAAAVPPALTFLGISVRRGSEFTWNQAYGTAPINFAYLSDEPEEPE